MSTSMYIFFFIVAVALLMYIRFFITNSLANKGKRIQTWQAAKKAIYFIPVFQQGFMLFISGIIYFFLLAVDFYKLLIVMATSQTEWDTDFLYIANYFMVAPIILCLTFMLAKASMNRKLDAINIIYKLGYLIVSILATILLFANIQLLVPLFSYSDELFFYNHLLVIAGGIIANLTILLFPLFYKAIHPAFKHLRLTVYISISYLVIVFLMATEVFLFVITLRAIK
jgi:hypothetical protein